MIWRLITGGAVAAIDDVLTWVVQSAVLLAAGLLAGRLLRRRGPAVQSTVYRTLLVAVLLCPIASTAIAALGFPGLLIRLPTVADSSDEAAVDVARFEDDRLETRGERRPRRSRRRAIARLSRRAKPTSRRLRLSRNWRTAQHQPLRPGAAPSSQPRPTRPARNGSAAVGAIVFAFWVLGSAILAHAALRWPRAAWSGLRGTAIRRRLEAEALCHGLAQRMRLMPPAVLRSPFLSSPCLDGLRRPAILLPEDAEQNLRETFVHELAHLGRRDGLWNLLRRLATAALWVQPLLWVLSRRIEATAEEVCDDFVVSFGADRARYAGHLLDLARRRLPPLAPSAVGMVSLRSLLARRIMRILDSTRSISTGAGRRAIAATLLAGLTGTLLAGLLGVGRDGAHATGKEPKVETLQAGNDPRPMTSARSAIPVAHDSQGPRRWPGWQAGRGRDCDCGPIPPGGGRSVRADHRPAGNRPRRIGR